MDQLLRGPGRFATKNVVLLAVLLLFASCAVGVSAQDPQKSTTKQETQVQQTTLPIYADGSFFGSWRDNSVGCVRCNVANKQQRRNSSTASFSAVVQPWGALVLASNEPVPSDRTVLDLWLKGSGLTSVALYVKNTASKQLSREVRFQRADQLQDGVSILSNTDDGFLHVQVDLSALRITSNSTSAAIPSAAGAASCGGPAAAAAARFDRIVIADISGMGFTLVLSEVTLLSKDTIQASDLQTPAIMATKPPVFAADLNALKAGKNRYIIKLKPGTSFAAVNMICLELAGQIAEPTRFNGLCNTPLNTLRKGSTDNLSWGLVTITVASESDLQRMREALASHIEYFEADLTGFTTIRALKEAATSGKATGFNITTQPAVVDGSQPAQRPNWARSIDADEELPSWVGRSRAEDDPPVPRFQVVPSPAPTVNSTANATANVTVEFIGGNSTTLNDTSVTGGSNTGVDHITPVPLSDDQTVAVPSKVEGAETEMSIQSVASWGLDRINQVDLPLDGAYSSGDYDGRGVHVYVLDTGVRATHSDFKGRVGAGASAVGSSVADDQGHGTHVSGIVLGTVHGVAPSAILHPVKVMDSQGNGAYSNIVAGIQWAKDHKLKNNIASAVLSMSIAGPRSVSLNDAVEAAVAAGITVVTAAGNNKGGDACSMSPASASSTITVGASSDDDTMASMSNVGACLSLFAPGNYIASAGFSSDNSEVYMSGTSMAAPHVAGAAALYLQYRPGAPPAEVKAVLKRAAVGRFFESSSPQLLLNVISSRLRAAQQAVAPTPVAPPKPSPSPSPKPVAAPSSPSPAPFVVVRPSPSPTPPVAPAPAPPATAPAPAAAPALAPFPSMFPSGSFFTKPAICSTCKWCTLLCS